MVEETATMATATTPPAPTRRFAPNGAKATAHGTTGVTSQPSFVFLRVKRKRHEDPVECLLVQSEPELKRQQRDASASTSAADTTAADDAVAETVSDVTASSSTAESAPPSKAVQQRDLLAAFSKLSTRERGFVFTRIDTLEPHQLNDASDGKWAERLKKKAKQQRVNAKKAAVDKAAQLTTQNRAQQQQARLKERRHSDALRTRGLQELTAATARPQLEMKEQKTLEVSGLRMVDLTTVTSGEHAKQPHGETAASSLTVNGAKLAVKRVMNPYEREVDEAVWTAFQHNDFSAFFRLFHSHHPELRVDPAAFQRPADGGTVLMAAATHGRADVIEAVLRSSAASVLQEDWTGATASAFARQHGHTSVETALLACEEAEREKEYVYDVYCIDTTASEQHSAGLGGVGSVGGVTAGGSDLSSAPVVSVSSAVQRWLSQEAGQQVAEEDDVEEFMLESDQENDLDSDGESIDSNHENYAFNDYPDEDSSDYDSDDSEENLRHRAAGTGRARDTDERVCADEVDY